MLSGSFQTVAFPPLFLYFLPRWSPPVLLYLLRGSRPGEKKFPLQPFVLVSRSTNPHFLLPENFLAGKFELLLPPLTSRLSTFEIGVHTPWRRPKLRKTSRKPLFLPARKLIWSGFFRPSLPPAKLLKHTFLCNKASREGKKTPNWKLKRMEHFSSRLAK